MKSSSQNRASCKTFSKRTIALALLICFISVSLLSEAFILTNASHTHDHNGVGGLCATCVQILNAENVLRFFGMAVILGFIVFAGYYVAITLIRTIYSNIATLTPVILKIRMNN